MRQHDRTSMRMFLDLFGRNRGPATLSQRDWDRFIRERRAGRIGPSGRPVADRTVEYHLKFLIAVFNWAARSRDERGRLLLDRNPLKGLRTPGEKNPNRVVLDEEEYRALLEVSRRVDWRFRIALVLAHETGHRIGAIRQLRWDDIDFDGGANVWRAEHDKTGYEHVTPVTPEALDALEEARSWNPTAGDAPVMPAPRNPSACMRSRVGAGMVGQGREAGGAGVEARQGLALAAAQVRLRPDGPAAEGALPTRRLEDGQDGASVLSGGRRGTASEGSGRPPPGSLLKSRPAGIIQREIGLSNMQPQSPQQDAKLQPHVSPALRRSRCAPGRIRGPHSSRLASGALRRSRCSSGPVHGPPALRSSRCSREIIRRLLGVVAAERCARAALPSYICLR